MDIIKYEKFIKLIKEGLIMVHNIVQYKDNLSHKLSMYKIKHEIDIVDKLKFTIKVFYPSESDLQWIINDCVNIYGYYPSYYYMETDNKFKRDDKWQNFSYSKTIKTIKIVFEAKYTDSVYKNDIICPDILYHLTDVNNLISNKKNNILKVGIYPKSYNRISSHPSRIYLFPDIGEYKNLLSQLKKSDSINNITKKYSLLEIKTNGNLILHTDPNYVLGYYTYDNIPPNKIKELYTDL